MARLTRAGARCNGELVVTPIKRSASPDPIPLSADGPRTKRLAAAQAIQKTHMAYTNPFGKRIKVEEPIATKPKKAAIKTIKRAPSSSPESSEGAGASSISSASSVSKASKVAKPRAKAARTTNAFASSARASTSTPDTKAAQAMQISVSSPPSGLPGLLMNGSMRPYRSLRQLKSLIKLLESISPSEELAMYNGRYLHVPFSKLEMFALVSSIEAVRPLVASSTCPVHDVQDCVECIQEWLRLRLRGAIPSDIASIAVRALQPHEASELLSFRQSQDIENFLVDASNGNAASISQSIYLSPRREAKAFRKFKTTPLAHLRLREMSYCAGYQAPHKLVKLGIYDTMKPRLRWEGRGSGDVVSVAWCREDNLFAAGCIAFSDAHNMQYNRCNNLLLGYAFDGVLKELPHHTIPYVRPTRGPNSTDEAANMMGPMLFTTVSSVDFSPCGRRMYTASYDKTVKVWDVGDRQPLAPCATFAHDEAVDILATSINDKRLLATGSKSFCRSIRVFVANPDEGGPTVCREFSSVKAIAQQNKLIYPSCLKWATSNGVPSSYLLAGFSGTPSEEDGKVVARDGDLCIYDVEANCPLKVVPNAQNVFDCAWHPVLPIFAVGCVADQNANKGTNTYLRVYERNHRVVRELECPALDINEVTWGHDSYYCSVSCTDGKTYVWDIRGEDKILHVLSHGQPIEPIVQPDDPNYRPRERADTGVKFAQWGGASGRFYTGSSDGVVKVWDFRRAVDETLVCDLAQLDSGIMCGKFSHDYSQLLLGDCAGGVNVYSTQIKDSEPDELESFEYVPYHL